MSTPELPPPVAWLYTRAEDGGKLLDFAPREGSAGRWEPLCSAEQVLAAYRAGRLAGLEEAAKVAVGLNGWGSQPAPALARHIVTAIRALKEKPE